MSKTFTVIKGPKGSGKTTQAKRLIGASKFVEINDSQIGSPFEFRQIKKDTEYILFEGISDFNLKYLEFLRETGPNLVSASPNRYDLIINIPHIICTIQE
jgi:ABC-type cobalamin/Fe3+-siderophores transport system ATPase subunit